MADSKTTDDWIITPEGARLMGRRIALVGGPRAVPAQMLHSVAHCFLAGYDQVKAEDAEERANAR